MFLVKLSRGQWAKVDAEDLLVVGQYRWYALPHTSGGFYAVTKTNGKTLYMHRLIVDAPQGKVVDHVNHDTLDNRRVNLKICGQGGGNGNMFNRRGANKNSTTGVRGVYFQMDWNRQGVPSYPAYVARVMVNRKSKTKRFPHTEDGFRQATAFVERLRLELSEV